jgi:hypothetical protein
MNATQLEAMRQTALKYRARGIFIVAPVKPTKPYYPRPNKKLFTRDENRRLNSLYKQRIKAKAAGLTRRDLEKEIKSIRAAAEARRAAWLEAA